MQSCHLMHNSTTQHASNNTTATCNSISASTNSSHLFKTMVDCTAVEVGVPKLGNCLEMYTCAQASVRFVHSMRTNLDTPCTLKLLLGHPLYTGAVYMLAHRLGHMCTFPSSFQAWALQLLQQCWGSFSLQISHIEIPV